MSISRQRPSRPLIVNNGPRKKTVDFDIAATNQGTLSPEYQPSSPPDFHATSQETSENVVKIGKYVVLDPDVSPSRALDLTTGEEFTCKIYPVWKYREALAAYWQVDGHPNITSVHEVVLGETKAYVFFPHHYGDLHSYVRHRKRLKEEECRIIFHQIVSAVHHCHASGLVLRDLKMRKFVFVDPERTTLRLEGLEDAVVLEGDEDRLADRHGCPAYVSPEILVAGTKGYSGRGADLWSLGIMLYTMLVGRYPFHDPQPLALFTKIRRGLFTLPEMLSSKAKCLLHCLLRRDPSKRLPAEDILLHPWFYDRSASPLFVGKDGSRTPLDQKVPDMGLPDDMVGL